MSAHWNLRRAECVALLERRIPGYQAPPDWDVVAFQREGVLIGAAAVRRLSPPTSVMIDFALEPSAEGAGGWCFRSLLRCLRGQGVLHVVIDVPVASQTSGYLERLGPALRLQHARADHFEFFTRTEARP